MIKYIIFILFIFTGIVSDDKTVQIPKKDFLSYSWALYVSRNPGHFRKSSKEEAVSQSKTYFTKAVELSKKKKYKEAKASYEEALELFANGEYYYEYGNTLSNIPDLKGSVEAYKIAEKLSYKRPELVLYNIACSYSRMNKAEDGYKYLALAVDRGYNAFKYIQKDPDMENLRKRSDWEERIQELVPKSVKFKEKDFVGALEVPGPRSPDEYFLCSNGTVLEKSICEKGFYRGKWKLENGDINVSWEDDCREVGVGKIVSDLDCRVYEKYVFKACKKPDSDRSEKTSILGKTDIYYMKGILKSSEEGYGSPVLKSNVKEPKVCDPDFKPKNSKELSW
ncbi:MAG TPA: hypothetical protein PK453_05360 [Leptospiraceae bacterium]|nr:hypothetical protein [Leptospiraceae bacterium]